MRSAAADPAHAPDLTAKARIREAAMALFAKQGVAASSLRAVARGAGVSPALVVHHFGSKEGLCEAVDEAVVARFTERLREVPIDGPDLLERRAEALAELMRDEPTVTDYIARALAEGTDASADLFHRLFTAARNDGALIAAGVIRGDTDPQWRAFQQLILILGPLMLRPLIERELGERLYAPDTMTRWMAANVDLLRNGIYDH
jgi:TetR/AcrR family transcriptional regulator, regulator of cefoperazone and chloramphenicol sensitivity